MRMQLGLVGALALLAACGPKKPSTDDDVGDGPDETSETSETSDGSDPEALCTPENYADDPQLLGHVELGCFPVGPEGTCPICDAECMTTILYSCPPPDDGTPDFGVGDECGNHLTLCGEQLGDQCCYLVTASASPLLPGRPLREHGRPRLPKVLTFGLPSGDDDRGEAAAAYREFARCERASVDAFLHAAAILAQLDAPLGLIDDHRDAARQEAEHARLALAAAQALDGRSATLAELTPAKLELDLESFVRDLIHDGCIGELIAAREAAWALDQPCVREREALHDYWAPVANDEAGHARLAWQTLEWLLDSRPELRPMIVGELARATRISHPVGPVNTEGFGVASDATRQSLRRLAIAELSAEARAVASATT